MLQRFFAAISFLTIIPVGRPETEENLAKSISFFPLVGLMIGGLLVLVRYLASGFFSSELTSLLVVGVWAVMTGFLHLDGFCDIVDGLCGGRNKDEVLRIMEEPNIGAKGAAACFFLLLLKVFCLSEVSASALLIAPMMGRWVMVVGAAISSYPKSQGLGKTFVEHTGKKELLFASPIIMIGFVLFKFSFFWLLLSSCFIILPLVLYLKKRIGGLTGDTLGALCEVTETFVLLILCKG